MRSRYTLLPSVTFDYAISGAFFVGRARELAGKGSKKGRRGLLPAFFKVIISDGRQNARVRPRGHQTSHACHPRNYNVNGIRGNKCLRTEITILLSRAFEDRGCNGAAGRANVTNTAGIRRGYAPAVWSRT